LQPLSKESKQFRNTKKQNKTSALNICGHDPLLLPPQQHKHRSPRHKNSLRAQANGGGSSSAAVHLIPPAFKVRN
jgi:hypothetical protein